MFLHVVKAEFIADHRVHVWFNNHTDAEIDLSGALNGPVFQPLKDVSYFRQFRLEGHTLAWENGADFAPEFLHSLAQSTAPA